MFPHSLILLCQSSEIAANQATVRGTSERVEEDVGGRNQGPFLGFSLVVIALTAGQAGRQANIDRDAALLKAEQASTETSSVKAELATLRMTIDASKLESQHQAETLALTVTQMEHANKEAASRERS